MIDTWTDLEDAIHKELKLAQQYHRGFCQRFYDTKSAGNFLPEQPSDFMAGMAGKMTFIEAKFSGKNKSLRSGFSGAVSAGQLASARITARAGFRYIILFYSSVSKEVEVWEGPYCADRRSLGKPLEPSKCTVYPSVEEALKREIGYD